MNAKPMDRRLHEQALLGRRVEGDRLVLDDATLLAALDGSRPLRSAESAALQDSPLTVRRFRQLALERRAAARTGNRPGSDTGKSTGTGTVAGIGTGAAASGGAGASTSTGPASAPAWRGSRGMLRAASSGGAPAPIRTDDGCWTLHFIEAADGWRTILQLAADAPFAATLLAARAPLQVRDGAGRTLLEGRLDADGECEAAWPLAAAPGTYLQAHGAAFTVTPVAGDAVC